MDVLKAAGKVGSVGRHAVAAAVLQKQLETERGVLAEFRADALSLRAQIGEEMYKLWKAGQPCPPWLDEICQALESTSAAIGRQRAIIDQLVSGGSIGDDGGPDFAAPVPLVEVVEEPATLIHEQPAEPPQLTEGTPPQVNSSRVTCPSCGEGDVAGRRFCGFCGTKLS
jgi:hypothetical protein